MHEVKTVTLFWNADAKKWVDKQPRTWHQLGLKIRGGYVLYELRNVPEYITRPELAIELCKFTPPVNQFCLDYYLRYQWGLSWGVQTAAEPEV